MAVAKAGQMLDDGNAGGKQQRVRGALADIDAGLMCAGYPDHHGWQIGGPRQGYAAQVRPRVPLCAVR